MNAQLINGYEVVIGFETHAQLQTKSKIFSRASTAFGAAPNTQASVVDMALPGTLPVMNREAVACAIKLGLALGSHIAPRSVFARKNYFYPDLPKGYQISQFEIPVVQGGEVSFFLDGDKKNVRKTVRLVRAHLEEDAGKSLHDAFQGMSGIDLNRAGTPLLEIVTEPDIRSTEEAVAYAKELHKIVTWIGICDGNMQEGSFRCDANVSVRKPGQPLGTRREIKNLNSFRFMQQAIDFEIRWQIEQLEDGHAIQQATVLFDPDTGETRAMRTKEDSADYRYFPDPDLPPLCISSEWIEQTRAQMPELPRKMAERFVADYGLPEYDAATLTQSPQMAAYFEQAAQKSGQPKLASNWVMGEISKRLNAEEIGIESAQVTAQQLAQIIQRIQDGTISHNAARQVFDALWRGEASDADAVIEAKGLKQMNDTGALEKIIDEVIAANPANVEQYRAGKDKAFNALVGQVMKASKGKANPQQVNELLRAKLA
ncbi:Asp-tRNA(Asn)/Glu-tRNA(Gln) amidotransferase subunit GatB [Ottowia cancrivicina]|uniref:Aspartyl/glutamyl-tRNA(Asn/Gln) amidotransferase subunit B n=1 Tax=Ottowia cancrivicina TaxID=3040346 RepID=A0AAW6RKY0_9BURK|nr:Asp-tRNA(Asn)/Glu-tRNA(Gln) amidotransferase subunit GatB [Ottowia sp. 10c7w1]MDG9698547.1 Asp-tRNA(Asn)/Glu-tRNA(Gln) amidotransferase subunit GatB [Ottowia sp. 10c7w1]